MLRVLHWLFHFVLDTIANINPTSQVTALYLILVISGTEWE